MCGRYLLDVDFNELYQQFMLFEAQTREIPTGEVFPTNNAPVVIREGSKNILKFMNWGLPAFHNNQRLINARVETLLQKPRFSRLMNQQRCIVPATAFYEWEKRGKEKIRHTFAGAGMILFAGLYESTEAGDAFTIITMDAAGDAAKIHDRMPVALTADAARMWLDPAVGPGEAYELAMRQRPQYFMKDEDAQLTFL